MPSASFWNFAKGSGAPFGWLQDTEPTEKKPGVPYLVQYAHWIITPTELISVSYSDEEGVFTHRGVTFKRVKREAVENVLK